MASVVALSAPIFVVDGRMVAAITRPSRAAISIARPTARRLRCCSRWPANCSSRLGYTDKRSLAW